MKMTNIIVMLIQTPPPHSGGNVWYTIKIETDEGVSGLGESMPHFAFAGMEKSYKKLAEDVFERWFKGRDPVQREKLFKESYSDFCASHPDMLGLSILSAIDMAMWDICGKAVNLPVFQLLGGKFRDSLRSYSYISYDQPNGKFAGNYSDLWGDPQIVCERAREMMEDGFTALKYDPLEYILSKVDRVYKPYHLTLEDYRVVRATLDALKSTLDNKCDLIIGTHGQMTTASAISFAKFLENHSPLWFEEPVPPENSREMAKVRKSTSIPIAAGERIMSIYEYKRFLEDGAVSIIQPDLGTCGGITQAKKIAAIAEAYYVDVAPHLWGGPVATAAAVQLSMCIPNFLIQESIVKSRGFHEQITTRFVKWKNGYIYPSAGSGLGVELNEKILKNYLLC